MMTNHNLSNLNQNADEDSLMVVLVDGGGDIFFYLSLFSFDALVFNCMSIFCLSVFPVNCSVCDYKRMQRNVRHIQCM